MSDGRANVKINSALHEKMKRIIIDKANRTKLSEEYELAIQAHINNFYQEKIIYDSKIEKLLDEKFTKIDKHLASMLGRTGMDVSMTLMGIINLLLDHFKPTTRETIINTLKKDGAMYYTKKDER